MTWLLEAVLVMTKTAPLFSSACDAWGPSANAPPASRHTTVASLKLFIFPVLHSGKSVPRCGWRNLHALDSFEPNEPHTGALVHGRVLPRWKGYREYQRGNEKCVKCECVLGELHGAAFFLRIAVTFPRPVQSH